MLTGFTACNRFKGSYTISGDRITIGNQTHTVNKCADPARDVEDVLRIAFDKPVRYAIVEGRLECNHGSSFCERVVDLGGDLEQIRHGIEPSFATHLAAAASANSVPPTR